MCRPVDATSVHIAWQPPEHAQPPVKVYTVKLRETETESWSLVRELFLGEFHITFHNLVLHSTFMSA